MDGSNATLEVASAQQQAARDRVTFEAWGETLTAAQFIEREARLRRHAFSRASLTTWLLCEGDRVLASCETYRMASAVQSGGGHRPGSTYGVASVFTEPALRGRGYASLLLTRLEERLRATDPEAQATILFSDVAPPIYERLGYELRPAFDRVLTPEVGDPADGVDRLLGEDDLFEPTQPPGAFVVVPSARQLDWHLERERTYASLLGRRRPSAVGARLGQTAIVWMASFRHERLYILIVDGPAAPAALELEALLLSARRAAQQASLREVRLWQDVAIAGSADPDHVARTSALPMIRPLARTVDAAAWRWIPRGIWM